LVWADPEINEGNEKAFRQTVNSLNILPKQKMVSLSEKNAFTHQLRELWRALPQRKKKEIESFYKK
jgi:hypothetical protein